MSFFRNILIILVVIVLMQPEVGLRFIFRSRWPSPRRIPSVLSPMGSWISPPCNHSFFFFSFPSWNMNQSPSEYPSTWSALSVYWTVCALKLTAFQGRNFGRLVVVSDVSLVVKLISLLTMSGSMAPFPWRTQAAFSLFWRSRQLNLIPQAGWARKQNTRNFSVLAS